MHHAATVLTALGLPAPLLRLCRARAEQAANQLRQEWQEQKQTLLMG